MRDIHSNNFETSLKKKGLHIGFSREQFRERRSRFVAFFGVFSATTREPLKVRRQAKHCKKGFHKIFQVSSKIAMFACEMFEKIDFFCFFCPFWASFLSLE